MDGNDRSEKESSSGTRKDFGRESSRKRRLLSNQHLLTLTLTGRLDRTVDATNANIAIISGDQKHIDHEYDRYKVDEGFCGTNGPRYKGPKEVTKTSTTTTIYNKETRVYADIGMLKEPSPFRCPTRTEQPFIHTLNHRPAR